MSSVAALGFPGGRVLAGWWRQLQPLQPRGLWLHHLLVHQVEALVRRSAASPLDRLQALVLKALAIPLADTVAGLDARLHLGPQFLARLLSDLQAAGLCHSETTGCWTLTTAGRQAAAAGEYARTVEERRCFHFAESIQHGRPAVFLNLHGSGMPWTAGPEWKFDLDWLQECVRQPPDWKQRHGFPTDVEAVLEPGAAVEERNNHRGGTRRIAVPPWQRVVIDRPQRYLVALVETADPARRLCGFTVHEEGWRLESAEPAFTLGEDFAELGADLTAEPSVESWRQAWSDWCRRRGLPTADTEACRLERDGLRLRIIAERPGERLRSAFKGDSWLLAGEGRVRAAVQLELAPSA